jgi:hypothetical protein
MIYDMHRTDRLVLVWIEKELAWRCQVGRLAAMPIPARIPESGRTGACSRRKAKSCAADRVYRTELWRELLAGHSAAASIAEPDGI